MSFSDKRVELSNNRNLNRNLKRDFLKYILGRLNPIQSRKPSGFLNIFNNSPCLLAILIIFLFCPFKISSLAFIRFLASFGFFAFLTSLCKPSSAFFSEFASNLSSSSLTSSVIFFFWLFFGVFHTYDKESIVFQFFFCDGKTN